MVSSNHLFILYKVLGSNPGPPMPGKYSTMELNLALSISTLALYHHPDGHLHPKLHPFSSSELPIAGIPFCIRLALKTLSYILNFLQAPFASPAHTHMHTLVYLCPMHHHAPPTLAASFVGLAVLYDSFLAYSNTPRPPPQVPVLRALSFHHFHRLLSSALDRLHLCIRPAFWIWQASRIPLD